VAIPAVVKARIPALAWLRRERSLHAADIIVGVSLRPARHPQGDGLATLPGLAAKQASHRLPPMLVRIPR
jgi:hypothetical protein